MFNAQAKIDVEVIALRLAYMHGSEYGVVKSVLECERCAPELLKCAEKEAGETG